MNPYTGELRAIKSDGAIPDGFERLRSNFLQRIAQKELVGRSSTYIDLTARTPLANWAAKARKKKRLAKIAAKSRRINRGRK